VNRSSRVPDGAQQILTEEYRVVAELDGAAPTDAGFQVVAFLDGQPAAVGGCTDAAGVARLCVGGEPAGGPGTGSYRAVLAGRLAIARANGASLVLVKGRVETSGPILRRAGFTAYGEERCYALAA